jgi:hypothetical protein
MHPARHIETQQVLYVVLFWTLGDRVRHPWLRTGIFWIPVVFIPFLFLIPWGWGFGVLLYLCMSLIVAALSSYGGCEVVALPGLLFRRHYAILLPAHCHRPGRASLHAAVNGSEDQD